MPQKTKVLITASYLQNGHHWPFAERLREAGLTPIFPARPPQQLSLTERLKELQEVPLAIVGVEPYPSEILEKCPNLFGLCRAGVGVDSVDLVAAARLGIAVSYVPEGNADAVAEHSLSLILALARRIGAMHALVENGGWTREAVGSARGKTLGLWGYGPIAKRLERLAEAVGMRVMVHSRSRPSPSLEELAQEADFLSLHAPLTEATRHQVNAKLLAQMKPTAFLINTARAGLVVTADLVTALKEGRIAGAAIDVFDEEPLQHNPFAGLKNVLLSPHLAGVDEESVQRLSLSAAQSAILLAAGKLNACPLAIPLNLPAWRGADLKG